MSEDLYGYYERELIFIRQLSQDFARKYPAAAGRLLLESNRSVDPHVERLIQAFAFVSGRIHHKLDDEFPELTESLLSVLYPHYLAPIPSLAILQFELDPERAELPQGFTIPRQSRVRSQPIGNVPCRFRTGYPVTLWPVRLADARLTKPPYPAGLRPPPRTVAILRLQLECMAGLALADLELERLRFYLSGEKQLVAALYETLFNQVLRVDLRPGDGKADRPTIELRPEEALGQVGFDRDDSLLPYPSQSFPGYRLLTEFFAFPPKFTFLDLCGLDRVCRAGFRETLEVVLFLRSTERNLEQGINAETFRLGCTPIINLFEQTAEPIPLTHARAEYRITPDVANPDGMEVYSVDSVKGLDPSTRLPTEYHPFYSFHHGSSRDEQQAFWHASRRPSLREGDRGTEVFLRLVDLNLDPRLPAESTLVVKTTCTNREHPRKLQKAGERISFTLETVAPLARVVCLRTPTAPLRPPMRRGAQWRLISHLSLNHLSLTDPSEGLQALQEILRLYDFSDPGEEDAAIARNLIEGITSLSSRRVVGWNHAPSAGGFCRGVEVTVEFDEQRYLGTGVMLFASVLERFLGLYATINSFSQLVGKTKGGGVFKTWAPREGEHAML